ncbi:MAG: hemerythrin domain-containing protein [Gammaproteobacteria bacterium]|nr:hemerythrin domain-containing protein [Gammaproteobacteria bacterium]
MDELTRAFTANHKHCDEQFAQLEQAAAAADWARAGTCYRQFSEELLRHVAAEEEILFPAFEQAAGHAQGPTRVMCMEHDQMRELLQELSQALAARDAGAAAGIAETLLILMQQHNVKEEQILYPMLDEMVEEGVRREAIGKLAPCA